MRKVLVVNKYHFISGGAERYFLTIMESLRKRGIEAIPLSVNYAKTISTPYQKYFIEPVVRDGAAKIQNQNPTLRQKAALAMQAVYNFRAVQAVEKIAAEVRPDLAYFLNFNNHVSPSAIDACSRRGIPVIMRMSDFNLSCVSNMYYRHGNPCQDCKKGLHHAIRNRCVHDSLVKSATAVAATAFHRWSGVYRKVRAFVTPTEFMKRDLMELGYPEEIIHQINTFARPMGRTSPDLEHPYILFVGRFARYKGIDTAIKAFARMRNPRSVELRLVGDEGDHDAARVKALASSLECRNLRFLPFERDKEKLLQMIQRSLFTLVPSENYENLPNTLLESFSCGRPVIATRLGSIPDIVREGEFGLLYDYGNVDDFAGRMEFLIENDAERERMGETAYRAILTDFSEDQHMEKLLFLFEAVSGKSFSTAEAAAACSSE